MGKILCDFPKGKLANPGMCVGLRAALSILALRLLIQVPTGTTWI